VSHSKEKGHVEVWKKMATVVSVANATLTIEWSATGGYFSKQTPKSCTTIQKQHAMAYRHGDEEFLTKFSETLKTEKDSPLTMEDFYNDDEELDVSLDTSKAVENSTNIPSDSNCENDCSNRKRQLADDHSSNSMLSKI